MYNSYQSGYADSNINSANHFAGNSNLNLANNNNLSNNSSNVQPQLWMGDLDFNWDETYIKQLWTSLLSPLGIMVHSIKLIRNNNNNNNTGAINSNNSGYCFVRFNTYDDATKVLNLYNGKQVPNSSNLKFFKLNWASSNQQQQSGNHNSNNNNMNMTNNNNANNNTGNNSMMNNGNNFNTTPEYSIFVGDLAPTITEPVLMSVFKERYPSVSNVKIMYDPNTGIPRGYGFIRFFNELEQKRSLIEMQGFVINGRSIRVSTAAKPSASNNNNQNNQNSMNYNNQNYYGNQMLNSGNNGNNNLNRFVAPPVQSSLPLQFYNDPTNTTIFIGNLNVDKINEYELYELFSRFGEINYVKIPNSNSNSNATNNNTINNNGNRKVKNCGFIEFKNRKDAETALLEMQSFDIGDGYKLRISWGAKAAQRNLLNQLKMKLQNGDLSQSTTNSTTTPSISTSNSSLFYPTNQESLTNDLLLLQSLNMSSSNQNSINVSNINNQIVDPSNNSNSNPHDQIITSNANSNNGNNEFASSYISDEARLNDLLLAAKEGNLDNLDLKSGIYNV